jgi:hypothetical protein
MMNLMRQKRDSFSKRSFGAIEHFPQLSSTIVQERMQRIVKTVERNGNH